MKSLLVLRHLKVENANAIAGMTWGFPAISNFLGFTHALSRKLQADKNLTLGGCAVVCHQHSINAYQPAGWGDYVFALTRNPLTKEAKSPAFVEEARMHMEVSLLIECEFDSFELDFGTGVEKQDKVLLEAFITQQVMKQRLAGGTIVGLRNVEWIALPEDGEPLRKATRQQMLRLLPGFLLLDRGDLLKSHFEDLKAQNPEAELMDAWLDFAALKHQAVVEDLKEGAKPEEGQKAEWKYLPKPAGGYLVPITKGYQAISPLYENSEVARTRDPSTPFRFVESVYSVGQWISPHRIHNLELVIWRYQAEGELYLCQNAGQSYSN